MTEVEANANEVTETATASEGTAVGELASGVTEQADDQQATEDTNSSQSAEAATEQEGSESSEASAASVVAEDSDTDGQPG